jgi:hypothetical protein
MSTIKTDTIESITTNGALTLTPNGSGGLVTDHWTWPLVDGAANQILETDGSGNLDWVAAGGGKVVKRYYDEDAAYGSTTTLIPQDDSAPQSSEGTEILSITTDTLSSSSNRIRCFYSASLSCSSGTNYGLALFNGGSSAVHGMMVTSNTATRPQSINAAWEYAPGATTALVISVRYGGGSGTTYKNGHSGGRQWGGAQACTLIVEEIEP